MMADIAIRQHDLARGPIMLLDSSPVDRIETVYGKSRLTGWQFAADGKWDSAKRAFFTSRADSAFDEIWEWLDQQVTDDIAIEALFEFAAGERFFLGIRMTRLPLQEKSRIIRRLLTTHHKGDALGQVIKQARSAFGESQLAGGIPDHLELGVFDLWNRVKPLVVWNKDERSDGATAIIILPNEIKTRSHTPDEGFPPLHAPQTQPLMLEAYWRGNTDDISGFPCWIGLPVSEMTAGRYTLSEQRYLAAAEVFTGSSSL